MRSGLLFRDSRERLLEYEIIPSESTAISLSLDAGLYRPNDGVSVYPSLPYLNIKREGGIEESNIIFESYTLRKLNLRFEIFHE